MILFKKYIINVFFIEWNVSLGGELVKEVFLLLD